MKPNAELAKKNCASTEELFTGLMRQREKMACIL
jgi:hypothetical protein